MTNSTVRANQSFQPGDGGADTLSGAGLYLTDGGGETDPHTITGSWIDGNNASAFEAMDLAAGAGIFAFQAVGLRITDTTISNNNATGGTFSKGGGIGMEGSVETDARFQNSTISTNAASGPSASSGGLYVGGDATASLVHSTVARQRRAGGLVPGHRRRGRRDGARDGDRPGSGGLLLAADRERVQRRGRIDLSRGDP